MLTVTSENHWEKHARQWELVGQPLRPSVQDTDCFSATVKEYAHASGGDRLTALMLGVTPEIACMSWPEGTRLLAADYSLQMIQSVWTMQDQQHRLALSSDWNHLPLQNGSADIVIGDGCFTLLPYPEGYRNLAREVRRVLQDEGLFIMRFFVDISDAASPEAVHAQLLAGEIENFHIFKFRLAIALQQSAAEGVCVGDVWDNWNAQDYDIEALAAKLGWQAQVIRTIDAYRGMPARYTYPSIDQVEAALSPWFERVTQYHHDYAFGDNCPTLVMRPRVG